MGIRRRRGASETPGHGLRALGDQIDGRPGRTLATTDRARDGTTVRAGGAEGLRALGHSIDSQGPPPGRVRSQRGRTKQWSTKRKVLTPLAALLVLAMVAAAGAYAYARYRYGQIAKVAVATLHPVAPGQPFNMLVVGSDSRAGALASTGVGTSTSVSGQRSDVVMIWHVVPSTKQITILSIPRDTMAQMVGVNATKFGRFNRINASYNSGPSLLVQTIQDDFGIPISHVVEVDFGGFKGAVDALGGVHMDFKYPARDAWSGLDVTTTGCQLLNGTQALAVARSRHYQYEVNGQWVATPIGDLGRIKRQDAFLRALVDAAKREVNPLKLNSLLGSLPQGIVIDKTLSLGDLVSIGLRFHSVTPGTITTYTLPTTTIGAVTPWGDVLFVTQPADQQLLVKIFGSELMRPIAPPPNTTLQAQPPPSIAATTRGSAGSNGSGGAQTASTPAPPPASTPTFDPTPC